MAADPVPAPLARLLAGGRHNRLAILGQPPPELSIGDTSHFALVLQLLRPGQSAPLQQLAAVADPERLPFIEAVFDRLLVTTPLPVATARAELRELWRVMAPAALALLVIKARRPWQFGASGWLEDALRTALADQMFEAVEWAVEAIPERHHLVLVNKRDGLRTAPIGLVEDSQMFAPA